MLKPTKLIIAASILASLTGCMNEPYHEGSNAGTSTYSDGYTRQSTRDSGIHVSAPRISGNGNHANMYGGRIRIGNAYRGPSVSLSPNAVRNGDISRMIRWSLN